MRLGLYFDLRDPPGWRRGWRDVYAQALELIEDADRRGIGSIWLSEHHLFADGYLPQPLVFAAAAAARTRRARIGTAVLLAPLRSPVSIAEEAAVVDLISGGRLDLGLGAGYRVSEYEAFGADVQERLNLLEGSLRELPRIFAEGAVTPAPVQSPLPLWAAAHGPRSGRMAGRLGVGLLSADPELWGPYRQGLQRAGHRLAAARASGPFAAVLSKDPERTAAILRPYADYQSESYLASAREGLERAPESFVLPPMFRAGVAPPPVPVLTVEQALGRLNALSRQMELEHVFLWASVGGMPDELVHEHVGLLIDRLIPMLAPESSSSRL